jgi:signal transduction histidine kinase
MGPLNAIGYDESVDARSSVMRKLLLLLLAAAFPWPAPAAAAAKADNVLLVYSDERLLPANVEADRALRETVVGSSEHPVDVHSEFLDRSRFSGDEYDRAVVAFLREKYSARRPAVMFAASQYALRMLLGHRDDLFPGTPIVYAGVDPSVLSALAPLPADVVGIPVAYDYAGTLDAALRLQPKATHLVLITGAGPIGRSDEAELHELATHLNRPVQVEFLAGQPMPAVLERVAALGPDAVVFTGAYFADGDGRIFTPREAAQAIAAASTAPVYGPFNPMIGTGIVGGRMPSFAAIARQAGLMINALLDGATPQSLAKQDVAPTALQVDWRQVRRLGIDQRLIPAGAILHFKEPTFWEAYGHVVGLAALVIALQAVLIAGLLYGRRRQRLTAAALAVSEQSLTLAARMARLNSWVWSLARDPGRANGTMSRASSVRDAPKEPIVEFDDVLASAHPADRETLARAVNDAVAQDQELDVEYRVVAPDQVRWIAARGRVEHGERSRLRGVALDITERKNAELQAEQDRTALRHMTRVSLLGQMSASIAHQLNQPLAAILGNAEAARKMLDRDGVDIDELKAIQDDIIAADHRAAAVVRRLSALFKRGERELSAVDINELIRETLELLRTDLATRHVVATTQLSAALPPVHGDRVQLQQVILNLILNATDAMNGVEESARTLTIRTEPTESGVRLCVSDRGSGIAAQDLDSIFDPFWSTKTGGMGIGLAVCRTITSAHGGSLTVANNADAGATFCVTLPAQVPA